MTTLGKVNAQTLSSAKRKVADNASRIRDSYGDWLSDDDIWLALNAESDNAVCAKCGGLPCRKFRNQGLQPTLKPNHDAKFLYVVNSLCKYFSTAREQKRLKELFRTAEIPAQYSGLTFDDYKVDSQNKMAVQAAHKLLDELDKGVFYYGAYGTGKTMLAAIIAQEHLRRGRAVLFTKVPDLLRSIRATYNDNRRSEEDILQKIYSVPILILDDVKAVRQKKFAGETLFDIVDARYNAKLQTIMTSNDALKEVAMALDNPLDSDGSSDGSRIYDRCKQMCFPIKLDGKSRR